VVISNAIFTRIKKLIFYQNVFYDRREKSLKCCSSSAFSAARSLRYGRIFQPELFLEKWKRKLGRMAVVAGGEDRVGGGGNLKGLSEFPGGNLKTFWKIDGIKGK
jgi:hypothetical protein